MCILIHQPKGYTFSFSQFADFYGRNPDGFGAIVPSERAVIKSLAGVKKLYKLYKERVSGKEAVLHFRMRTHGAINASNCHPYKLTKEKDFWLMHNGILSGWDYIDELSAKSDTRQFCDKNAELLINNIDNEAFKLILGKSIGNGNKFAIVDDKGIIHIINRHAGVVVDGVWYSNTYAWDYAATQPKPKPNYLAGNAGLFYDDADMDWGYHPQKTPARYQPELDTYQPLDDDELEALFNAFYYHRFDADSDIDSIIELASIPVCRIALRLIKRNDGHACPQVRQALVNIRNSAYSNAENFEVENEDETD
jgi:hypothetical protein